MGDTVNNKKEDILKPNTIQMNGSTATKKKEKN